MVVPFVCIYSRRLIAADRAEICVAILRVLPFEVSDFMWEVRNDLLVIRNLDNVCVKVDVPTVEEN